MPLLALAFIVVPAAELAILIQVGIEIGFWPTLGLVVLTGVIGAALTQQQGLAVIRALQARTARGEMPTSELVDGAMILFAGALLLTPGLLTDFVGFACLIPGARSLVKRGLEAAWRRAVERGTVTYVQTVRVDPMRPRRTPPGPYIDVEPPSDSR